LLAHQDHRLAERQAVGHLDVALVGKPGMDRSLPGFAIDDAKHRRPSLFDEHGLCGNEQGIPFAFQLQFDTSVHARPQVPRGVGQFDFREHGFGRLVERVGKARHAAGKGALG
jgi:hypothetical protein